MCNILQISLHTYSFEYNITSDDRKIHYHYKTIICEFYDRINYHFKMIDK